MTTAPPSEHTPDSTAFQKAHWEKDQSARRNPGHPSVRALFEPRADFLASLMPAPRSASVLDVGCGNGFLTLPLEARFGRAVGVDFSPQMIHANPAREKMVGDATALPFEPKSFDVVVASHLLHHLPAAERLAAVREMGRVARHAVVLYEPNRNHPLMFADGCIKAHERMLLKFSPGYVGTLIRESGLPNVHVRVEGWTTPNLCPPWWAGIGRRLDRSPLRALGLYIRAVARTGGAA